MTAGETGRPFWGNIDGDDFVDLVVGTETELLIHHGSVSGLSDAVAISHSVPLLGKCDLGRNALLDFQRRAQLRKRSAFSVAPNLDLRRRIGVSPVKLSSERDQVVQAVSIDVMRLVEVRLRTADGWGRPRAFTVGDERAMAGAGATAGVGDVNADGAQDLIVASVVVSPTIEFLGQVEVFLGDGTGAFAEPHVLTSALMPDFAPQPLAVRDLDADGRDDIVTMLLERDDVLVAWKSVAQ